jgi:CheY-like chemotaxis protein
MFRFLVTEDNEPTLVNLTALLGAEFRGAVVDPASSVAEGMEFLSAAASTRMSYDAALLDFKLPIAEGENPEIDCSLCNEIRTAHRGTLVIHMTSFRDDPEVLKHLEESHSEPSAPAPFFVSKMDSKWGEILIERLKAFLYGKRIEEQMDALFGAASGSGSTIGGIALRRPASRLGGVTQRLAALTQDIEEHWRDLSKSVKSRVQSTFVVEATGEEIRVSLL